MDEAFLSEHHHLFDIVEIVGAGIAIIFELCLGLSAYSKLRRSQHPTSRALVFLFCFSFVFALLFPMSEIAVNVFHICYGLHDDMIEFIDSANGIFFLCFLLSLLLTLVTRLYITFKDSALRMSQCTVSLFVVLFVVLFILNILNVAGYVLVAVGNEEFGMILHLSAGFVSLFLYIAGCALAVRLFAVNLSKVAKFSVDPNDKQSLSLNHKQLRLLHLSAKYILLFFVAVLSTISTAFFILLISRKCGGLFASFDLCVNLLCLYLQFAFATNSYQKCCGYPDSLCRAAALRRTKMQIQKDCLTVDALQKEVISV